MNTPAGVFETLIRHNITYLRYDPDVTEAGLRGLGRIDSAVVQVLDSVERIADIQRVGATYAAQNIVLEYFKGF